MKYALALLPLVGAAVAAKFDIRDDSDCTDDNQPTGTGTWGSGGQGSEVTGTGSGHGHGAGPTGSGSGSDAGATGSGSWTVSTTTLTHTSTISECAQTVTNCPYRTSPVVTVWTETTTTLCPVEAGQTVGAGAGVVAAKPTETVVGAGNGVAAGAAGPTGKAAAGSTWTTVAGVAAGTAGLKPAGSSSPVTVSGAVTNAKIAGGAIAIAAFVATLL